MDLTKELMPLKPSKPFENKGLSRKKSDKWIIKGMTLYGQTIPYAEKRLNRLQAATTCSQVQHFQDRKAAS